MLSYNLDFNSCAIRDGFRKSSHNYIFSHLGDLQEQEDANATDINL